MSRNIKKTAGRKYDVAVIGGGIHGTMIAALAAVSGLSTVLLEKDDFGGRTSANSLKVVHGGLRYLQHMDLPRIRDSIISRRWLFQNFPHLVKPLQCIMPTSGLGVRSRAAMTAGLLLNDLLSCSRNNGVLAANHLGRGRVVDKLACSEIIRGIDAQDMTGGAVWYDGLAVNTERILLELVHLLWRNNGEAVNYINVDAIHEQDQSSVLTCTDGETGETLEFTAGAVVNATGPWCTQFSGSGGDQRLMKGWSKAVNLVVRPAFFPDYGVALEGKSSFVDKDAVIQKGKRLFFFVPWNQKTMIGTVYIQQDGPSPSPGITRQELQSILDEINQIYPAGNLSLADITNYHVGLMPSIPVENSSPFDVQLDKEECVVDHLENGAGKNVITVKTVKYTTAFTVACKALKLLEQKGVLKDGQWRDRVLSPFTLSLTGKRAQKIPPFLIQRYGRQVADVCSTLSSIPGAADGTAALSAAEIRYAVEKEKALHLEDLLFRRTGIAAGEKPDEDLINKAADEMALLCRWDEARKSEEIARIHEHFAPLALG